MSASERCQPAAAAIVGTASVAATARHAPAELRYRILGPLEILRGGRPCTPNALKRRTLLALLLLRANESVAADLLIDGLWGSESPRTAVATLQAYVAGVRRVLDPGYSASGADPRRHPVLATTARGYRLRVEPGALDLDRFRALAAAGRTRIKHGACDAGGDLLRRALAMWRGPALNDLGQRHLLDPYLVRLDEDYLGLLHLRIAADLCCGYGPEIVGELKQLCRSHPLREGFHEQLMAALAQSDRWADALGAYADARAVLIREAGIEPGPALRAAHRAVLEGRQPTNTFHCYGCAAEPEHGRCTHRSDEHVSTAARSAGG